MYRLLEKGETVELTDERYSAYGDVWVGVEQFAGTKYGDELTAPTRRKLSTNRKITPCLTCRYFAPLSGCTIPGDCLGYEIIP